MIFFAFFSIVVFILFALGATFDTIPHYEIDGGLISIVKRNVIYYVYGPVVIASNCVYPLLYVIFVRACGPFYYCDREHFVSEIQYYPVDLWFSDLFSGILYHIHINMFVQYLLQLSKKILILFAWNIIEYRNHYYVIAGDNKRISVVYYNGTTI